MSRRVLIDQSGFRIARPGWDAQTGDLNGLMFNGTSAALQIVQSGYIQLDTYNRNVPSGNGFGSYSADIYMPDQGFLPLLITTSVGQDPFGFGSGGGSWFQYYSNSMVRYHTNNYDMVQAVGNRIFYWVTKDRIIY